MEALSVITITRNLKIHFQNNLLILTVVVLAGIVVVIGAVVEAGRILYTCTIITIT